MSRFSSIQTWACALAFTLALGRARAQGSAQSLITQSGVQGGLIVHIGCGDGALTCGLHLNSRHIVHGLDPDAAAIAKARRLIRKLSLVGAVTVEQWAYGELPYADASVNLVIASNLNGIPRSEVSRVLCPGGVALVRENERWERTKKPWPSGLDNWPQFLHDSSGNAVSKDTVCGPPHHVQWIAGPRWARSHEHLATVSAVVASGGRLFTIVDEGPTASVLLPSAWTLVARDAFSGVLLWQRPIPSWEGQLRPFRSGPAELPRRLAATGDTVYVTPGYGAPVSKINGATGEVLQTYKRTNDTLEIVIHNGTLYLVGGDVDSTAAAVAARRRKASPSARHRRIHVLRAADGSRLWEKADADTDELLPLTLAVADGRLFFQNPRQLVCLDALTGRELWRADRPVTTQRPGWSTPTLVVADGVVLSADRAAPRSEPGKPVKMDWLVSWAGGGKPGELIAYAADTGRRLWSSPCQEGYTSPVGVFVIDGLVWTGNLVRAGDPGVTQALDLKTGAVKRTRPPDKKFFHVGMGHHRCYRDRATEKYLLLGRAGVEFVDVRTGEVDPNHWVRGTCQFGILPAYGLLYAPPHSCACYLNAKLNSFNALAPARADRTGGGPSELRTSPRLIRGPAWAEGTAAKSPAPETSADWPTYRHDPTRSGSTQTGISPDLNENWQAKIGGRLSSLTAADGRLFVAEIDAGTVHALDARTGSELWTYSTAARVDSPPSIYRGRVVFGSADGHVYCLNATDGRLVWRFRAAPEERRVMIYNALESPWPVHGSVLILPPATGQSPPSVYFVAGRSTYLDDGMFLYRLNLNTGAVLQVRNLNDRDPKTGKESQRRVRGFGMLGVLPDVLSARGDSIFMRHARFLADSLADASPERHLFCPTGFLDDSWWHRSYWMFGDHYVSGWGGWWQAGNQFPSGRILVSDDVGIYGFGRTFMPSGNAGQWAYGETYRLFATDKAASAQKAAGTASRRRKRPTKSIVPVRWQKIIGMEVRALVLAGKTLYAAGPSGNAAESLDAFQGRKGVILKAVDPTTGTLRDAWRLSALPVFDGMIAAGGRLFLAQNDGTVHCFSGEGGKPLARMTAPPDSAVPPPVPRPEIGIISPPKPLPPLPKARKHEAFPVVANCVIGDNAFGYRIAADKGKVGLVLRPLPTPYEKKAEFKVRMKAVPGCGSPRFYRNGFLAFGDGATDTRVVKCGLKFLVHQAIVQDGPTQGKKPLASIELSVNAEKETEVLVTVDLKTGDLTLRVGKRVLKARLGRKLGAITHVGYVVLNAASDFSPIDVKGE